MDGNATGNYASVNGLKMYYEVHGSGQPLVLLHGALSTIEVDFGKFLPLLARTRQVIAIEQQAHGHTADVDRPLDYGQMAEDTAALLRQIGIQQADVFGYSMGSGVALEVAIRHPVLVRKLVLLSLAFTQDGVHPGLVEGMANLKPEDMIGSPFQQSYVRNAPNPSGWAALVEKVKQQDVEFQGWTEEAVQSVKAPMLLVIGDCDIIQPEHAVEMFRLVGGGVAGDLGAMPASQLAMLPSTTHITIVQRADWLAPMVEAFLDAPMPEQHDGG